MVGKLGMGAPQLEAAVDEVALDRLKAEEAERESRAADEPLPDPERIPIEAPRAPRRTTSDLSTSKCPLRRVLLMTVHA